MTFAHSRPSNHSDDNERWNCAMWERWAIEWKNKWETNNDCVEIVDMIMIATNNAMILCLRMNAINAFSCRLAAVPSLFFGSLLFDQSQALQRSGPQYVLTGHFDNSHWFHAKLFEFSRILSETKFLPSIERIWKVDIYGLHLGLMWFSRLREL